MEKVDEVSIPVTPAPPACDTASTSQDNAVECAIDIPILDGRVRAFREFDVTHVPKLRGNDREVIFRDRLTGQDVYIVQIETQPSSHDVRKMTIRNLVLRKASEDASIVASATMPLTDEVLGVIAYEGKKFRVVEHASIASIRASQAAATRGDSSKYFFEAGDLQARLSRKYVHANKGKSRAGDLELVDREGSAIAIFLNHWAGSAQADDLGKPFSTSLITASQREDISMLPVAILSALLVVLRISHRNRDSAKELVRDLAVGTAASCGLL